MTDAKLDDLLEQLQSDDPAVRAIAVDGLAHIKDPQAIGPLVWLMGDSSLWVRCNAAEALGEFRTEAVVEPLVAFLRLGAELEIAEAGAPEIIPIRFHRFSRKADPAYTAWLESRGIDSTNDGLNLLVGARLALQRVGILATDALIDLLTDENPYVAYVAMMLLSSMSMQKRPLNALVASLQHKNAIIRAGAARALGRFGNLGAVESLVQQLDDENRDVRTAVIESLGTIADTRAADPLIARLETVPDLHAEIWAALANMGVNPESSGD